MIFQKWGGRLELFRTFILFGNSGLPLFQSWLIKVVVPADRAAAGPAGNEEGPLRHTLPLLLSSSIPHLILSTSKILSHLLLNFWTFEQFEVGQWISFPVLEWYIFDWCFCCSGISVGKEKLKFKNDLTSLDDKLRIANKVNNKYLELGGCRNPNIVN